MHMALVRSGNMGLSWTEMPYRDDLSCILLLAKPIVTFIKSIQSLVDLAGVGMEEVEAKARYSGKCIIENLTSEECTVAPHYKRLCYNRIRFLLSRQAVGSQFSFNRKNAFKPKIK